MAITGEASPHWLTDLLQRRFDDDNKGRITRKPIGFDFTREPFDPSSYYKQIGTFRDISRAATNVVNQEVANRIQAERQKEQEALQNNIRQALSGIQPNFTYNQNAGTASKLTLSKGTTPHTSKAANFFAARHGITNVGGWRAQGSVPNSDHPKGRALDFMTNNMQQGTNLANDVIRNAKQWGVTYVIWNRYIWTPSRGWRKYSGPSPHTDHVHVSFSA